MCKKGTALVQFLVDSKPQDLAGEARNPSIYTHAGLASGVITDLTCPKDADKQTNYYNTLELSIVDSQNHKLYLHYCAVYTGRISKIDVPANVNNQVYTNLIKQHEPLCS